MNNPPWLEEPIATVARLGERLPHALLIQGPGGWGEERVANAIALDLMGLAPEGTAREIAHPDLRWIAPDGGIIRIDVIRALIDFLMQTPQVAGRKIAVVEEADRMNVFAANALLKSLEEPPPESFIALATGAPERLPATIRSRCQRIVVRPGSSEDVLAWLVESGVEGDLAGAFMIEYGNAPYAILAAAEAGQQPLWPVLAQAVRSSAGTNDVAQVNREEPLSDVVERWLRVVHRLVREWPLANAKLGLDFAAELLEVRQAALLNTGLNRSMQLQRLALLWARLWRDLSMDPPPSISPDT